MNDTRQTKQKTGHAKLMNIFAELGSLVNDVPSDRKIYCARPAAAELLFI